MNDQSNTTGKKKWIEPNFFILDSYAIKKDTVSNHEANYHHVSGTHYDNSKGTLHIDKLSFQSFHS